jgi:ferric-dicitrate binding protein FerR (iron transport regulator)
MKSNRNAGVSDRTKSLIISLTDTKLPQGLHRQIARWFLSIPEGGERERAFARWAMENARPETSTPDRRVRERYRRLAGELELIPAQRSSRASKPGRRALRAAAVIIPVALTVGGAFALLCRKDMPDTSFSTGVDESRKLTLPDGTMVTMKSSSELSYSGDFIGTRNVRLNGEAYFDVVTDSGHPFTLNCGEGMSLAVLGTEFEVDARVGDSTAEVFLVEGSAVVEVGVDRVELTPGKKMTVDRAAAGITLAEISRGEMLRVKGEPLTIEAIPVIEALHLTADYYGRDLVIEPGAPFDEEISMILPDNVSVEEILEGIDMISGRTVCCLAGDTITVSAKIEPEQTQ